MEEAHDAPFDRRHIACRKNLSCTKAARKTEVSLSVHRSSENGTEIIKTTIENDQDLMIKGCYIPFDRKKDFEPSCKN